MELIKIVDEYILIDPIFFVIFIEADSKFGVSLVPLPALPSILNYLSSHFSFEILYSIDSNSSI